MTDLRDIQRPVGHGDILALGFGTTVAMWGIGYVFRLPSLVAPAWLLVLAMLGCLFAGGYVAGCRTPRGWKGGLGVGLLASALNLLILGSVLSGEEPNRVVPTALLWIPGSLIVGALLGTVGGAAGSRAGRAAPLPKGDPYWLGLFARVGVVATFLLIVIGGVVTSQEAGLAVVDWPNSFGYNMFLYPLSKMSGGIYYEHAHRLFGSLVGLTTLVLAVHLWRYDRRGWIKGLGAAALALVIFQGILGGLRVTGRFTLSTSQEDVAPNLFLAVVHGVVGQVFFGLLVAVAAVASKTWIQGRGLELHRAAQTDRGLSGILVGLLVIQLVLGAIQRHLMRGLQIHITLGILVAVLAVACGVRAWGMYGNHPVLPRIGKWLLAAITVQVLLGLGALVVIGLYPPGGEVAPIQVLVTTAHQGVGAFLLACAVLLLVWQSKR